MMMQLEEVGCRIDAGICYSSGVHTGPAGRSLNKIPPEHAHPGVLQNILPVQ